MDRKKIGFIIWKNEIPADFNAINSCFSDRFPIIIMDDNNTARGSAIGTSVQEA